MVSRRSRRWRRRRRWRRWRRGGSNSSSGCETKGTRQTGQRIATAALCAPMLHDGRSDWRGRRVRNCRQPLDTGFCVSAWRRGQLTVCNAPFKPGLQHLKRGLEALQLPAIGVSQAQQERRALSGWTHSSTRSMVRSACVAKRFSMCAVSMTKLFTCARHARTVRASEQQ